MLPSVLGRTNEHHTPYWGVVALHRHRRRGRRRRRRGGPGARPLLCRVGVPQLPLAGCSPWRCSPTGTGGADYLVLNLLGAVVVGFTLVVNLSRGAPLVSLARLAPRRRAPLPALGAGRTPRRRPPGGRRGRGPGAGRRGADRRPERRTPSRRARPTAALDPRRRERLLACCSWPSPRCCSSPCSSRTWRTGRCCRRPRCSSSRASSSAAGCSTSSTSTPTTRSSSDLATAAPSSPSCSPTACGSAGPTCAPPGGCPGGRSGSACR